MSAAAVQSTPFGTLTSKAVHHSFCRLWAARAGGRDPRTSFNVRRSLLISLLRYTFGSGREVVVEMRHA
jgi:hypothetical protein